MESTDDAGLHDVNNTVTLFSRLYLTMGLDGKCQNGERLSAVRSIPLTSK